MSLFIGKNPKQNNYFLLLTQSVLTNYYSTHQTIYKK